MATTTMLPLPIRAITSRNKSGCFCDGSVSSDGWAWKDWPGKAFCKPASSASVRKGPLSRAQNVDFADQAEPLQLIERRQDLHLRDHPAADNAYAWLGHRGFSLEVVSRPRSWCGRLACVPGLGINFSLRASRIPSARFLNNLSNLFRTARDAVFCRQSHSGCHWQATQ